MAAWIRKSKILLCFFRVRTAFLFSGSASTGSVKQNLHRKKWACHETISENTQNADSFHAAAFSYLAIILAPTVAIIVIYITMQDALLNIQKEKAQNLSKEAAVTFNKELDQLTNIGKYISSDSKLKNIWMTEVNFWERVITIKYMSWRSPILIMPC